MPISALVKMFAGWIGEMHLRRRRQILISALREVYFSRQVEGTVGELFMWLL
jgi:hypothetical protein